MEANTSGERVDLNLAYFLAFVSVALPIILVIFLYVNRKRIGQDEVFDQKYGVLYAGLDTRKLSTAIAFIPFYLFKRAWFTIVVFCFYKFPYIMMIANVYCQIAYMIFVGWSCPYLLPKDNVMNLVNETLLVEMLYLFFFFVNPATEQESLRYIGYGVVFLSFLIILTNVGASSRDFYWTARYNILRWIWLYKIPDYQVEKSKAAAKRHNRIDYSRPQHRVGEYVVPFNNPNRRSKIRRPRLIDIDALRR